MNSYPSVPNSLYRPDFEHDACGVGFVANIKGTQTHSVVQQGLQILRNLDHRGACGCEANTGDGAGILIQMPHEFLASETQRVGITLPPPGQYGVGMVYLPRDPRQRRKLEMAFEKIIQSEGQDLLGWRTVPTDNSSLGETAKSSEPHVRQVFIGKNPELSDDLAFERKLYVIRKRSYSEIRCSTKDGAGYWYICSLSCRTLVYKGMLMTEQVDKYFLDLKNPDMKSGLALVHSRFSTNTFPSWARSHPYRYIAHNGEINTLRGNINWMRAREALFQSDAFGDDIHKILPIVDPDGSDSANCDELISCANLFLSRDQNGDNCCSTNSYASSSRPDSGRTALNRPKRVSTRSRCSFQLKQASAAAGSAIASADVHNRLTFPMKFAAWAIFADEMVTGRLPGRKE